MSTLPFPLPKYHKSICRGRWTRCGMIFVDDTHFECIYNEYIIATNCDLCGKLFPNTRDRQLDHDHETGDVRNVVCCKCNQNRKDNKPKKTNTGENNISKCKNKNYKTGYGFEIQIKRDGKKILNTARNTLEKAIIVRDKFIEDHPGIYT